MAEAMVDRRAGERQLREHTSPGRAWLELAVVGLGALMGRGGPGRHSGWLLRIVATGSLWEVVIGSTIIGGGTGIGYAAMPTLMNHNTPTSEIAAANGLNSLSRSLGSSLASAVGGSILTASTIVLGGFALPSLGAYRTLFAICGAAAVAAAVAALFIPPGEPSS